MTQPPSETWPQQQGQQPYPPQQPYGQQFPPPYPGQQQGPPRGKRHAGRKILGVLIAVVAAAIIGGVIASNSGHQVKTAGSPAGTGGKPAASAARTGTAITLSGNGSGEQMAVTVVKTIGNAKAGNDLIPVPARDRLYAVQFRLSDTGSAAYSDAPSNGAAVTDSRGQSYQAGLADTAEGCQAFSAPENIAPGTTGLGCIVFEVPKSAKITGVQFTLDSGMGPQTGQWKVG